MKRGKETCSFPTRNPFTPHSFLLYWVSERYKLVESFAGVVGGDEHLCLFLALAERRTSQKCGVTRLGELHQLADKFLLLRRWRYVVQYLVLLGAVDTDVLSGTEVAYLRIKVIEANVIGWLQKESINKNNKRWTIWKRASFFLLLSFTMPQRTLYSRLQRYKFFTRRYTDFKKFIENFTVWNWKNWNNYENQRKKMLKNLL